MSLKATYEVRLCWLEARTVLVDALTENEAREKALAGQCTPEGRPPDREGPFIGDQGETVRKLWDLP